VDRFRRAHTPAVAIPIDAQRQRTPDCMNAAEAKRRSLVGSQKSLAPIDWGAAKTKP
jgi:hypothetical protein